MKPTSKRHIVAPVCALIVSVLSGAVSAGDLGDAQILGIYIQVNGFDIETALLGRAQAGAKSVRDLAEHVANDHAGARRAAYDIAAQCKVVPTLPEARIATAIEHNASMTKLLSLKGVEFDKAYAQHEVDFHRAAITAVRTTLLPSSTCPALVSHFKAVLPAFEHHLAATEAAARELGVR